MRVFDHKRQSSAGVHVLVTVARNDEADHPSYCLYSSLQQRVASQHNIITRTINSFFLALLFVE